ncbi:hypothetical protein GF361_05645 [Candidatus Woesearchaeota archaeon]|nr:hypothetical protein [Candidatus Woesearchaeota archaeon]
MFTITKLKEKYENIIAQAEQEECRKYALHVNRSIPHDIPRKDTFLDVLVRNNIVSNDSMKQAIDEYLAHQESSREIGNSGMWKSIYSDMVDCFNYLA